MEVCSVHTALTEGLSRNGSDPLCYSFRFGMLAADTDLARETTLEIGSRRGNRQKERDGQMLRYPLK